MSIFCLLGWTCAAIGGPNAGLDPFTALQADLLKDGFDSSFIRSLYSKKEAAFDQEGVAAYYLHREATLDYDQFLKESSISLAVDYIDRHRTALKEAQNSYGVEGEIITAIMLVESRLGTFVGRRLVLNTLSTLAALRHFDTRDRLWHTYLKSKDKGSKRRFNLWAARKSSWAYSELIAYFKYITMNDVDPFSVHGSFAGALGIAQFIPTSILRYAKDGNEDGRIDLFDHEDAIKSVANYLKQNGWRPSSGRKEAFNVLLSYNNSKYYADAILDIAKRLAGRTGQAD